MSRAEPFRLSRIPASISEALVGLLSAHEIESVSDIFCVDGDRIWMDRGRPVHHTMLPVVCAIASQLTATLESDRSEEHTSELQSLMRISYAVFCLKKKKTKSTKSAQPTT